MPTNQPAFPNARLSAWPMPPEAPVTSTEAGAAGVSVGGGDPVARREGMARALSCGRRMKASGPMSFKGFSALAAFTIHVIRFPRVVQIGPTMHRPPMTHLRSMLAFIILWTAGVPAASVAADELGIVQSSDYFPDTIGSRWEYRGQITEGPLQSIEHKFFTN